MMEDNPDEMAVLTLDGNMELYRMDFEGSATKMGSTHHIPSEIIEQQLKLLEGDRGDLVSGASTTSSSSSKADPPLQGISGKRRKRIISRKMRRKKMTLWLLILCLILVWTCLVDLLQRMYSEEDRIFSMSLIKCWWMPLLMIELVLTGVGLCIAMLKMKVMEGKEVDSFFRNILTFNNFQYVLVIGLLPAAVFLYFQDHLAIRMKAGLEHDAEVGEMFGASWDVTQVERRCCGLVDRRDWKRSKGSFAIPPWNNLTDPVIFPDTVYPASCCNFTSHQIHEDGATCIEGDQGYWRNGCLVKEKHAIWEYVGLTVALILAAFLLTVVIRLKAKRLEWFMVVFHPSDMF